MERKVQEVHGSLQVTIPKVLASRLDLRKGSMVHFEERNGCLTIKPGITDHVLWTIGYEGRSQPELIETLRAHGIQRLVDVRELPLSRRKGFSKTPLREALSAEGLEYIHLRELGAPKHVRKPFLAGGSFGAFREAYIHHLSAQEGALNLLMTLASQERTAIMCVEAAHSQCHRQFVAAAASERGTEIRHL